MAKIPLPPSIENKVRDHRGSRAGRVRVELTPSMAQWLHGLIGASMGGLDIDSPEFRGIYLLYRSIADQLEKLKGEDKQ